jgi:hypothetical protein
MGNRKKIKVIKKNRELFLEEYNKLSILEKIHFKSSCRKEFRFDDFQDFLMKGDCFPIIKYDKFFGHHLQDSVNLGYWYSLPRRKGNKHCN